MFENDDLGTAGSQVLQQSAMHVLVDFRQTGLMNRYRHTRCDRAQVVDALSDLHPWTAYGQQQDIY
ncbi:hypothetical protein AB4305_33415 [Nocardia sp. 2YAB30]|uniref:hypothetical protein n=1 Tax=Nocardia sp. 2YAB30 TaxID=3233022 RepID=UPI003F96C0CD